MEWLKEFFFDFELWKLAISVSLTAGILGTIFVLGLRGIYRL